MREAMSVLFGFFTWADTEGRRGQNYHPSSTCSRDIKGLCEVVIDDTVLMPNG
jgi:hypothetical protein